MHPCVGIGVPIICELLLEMNAASERGFQNHRGTYSPPTVVASVLNTRPWSIHQKGNGISWAYQTSVTAASRFWQERFHSTWLLTPTLAYRCYRVWWRHVCLNRHQGKCQLWASNHALQNLKDTFSPPIFGSTDIKSTNISHTITHKDSNDLRNITSNEYTLSCKSVKRMYVFLSNMWIE